MTRSPRRCAPIGPIRTTLPRVRARPRSRRRGRSDRGSEDARSGSCCRVATSTSISSGDGARRRRVRPPRDRKDVHPSPTGANKDMMRMSKTSILQPLSPYSSATAKSNIETHTLSVLVDNEPGVLARVVGMFAGRGYNIESLTVAEVAHETHLSRITIVTSGTPEIIEQIRHQLERLVPVHSVKDLTLTVRAIERELAMIKVRGKGENRVEAMRLADAFRAKVIDATTESFIFELTGAPRKIDDFVELMRPIGLVEVSRTGVAAISRGPEPI